jgi:hypothetical protein
MNHFKSLKPKSRVGLPLPIESSSLILYNYACHSILGVGYDVEQDESSQELLGVNISEAQEN